MKESVRIIRFAIIGTLNALIAAFVVLHIEGESYIIANICAYIVAQIHNFIWCKYWIFPLETDDKKNSIWHQMLFFIQFLFLLMLVELLHCNEYLAQFLGLFVYGAVNFICNRRLTFR